MNKPVRVSTPIGIETDKTRVYEYELIGSDSVKQAGTLSQVSAKKLIIWSQKGDVWKSESERNKIFSAIWFATQDLPSGTSIEVRAPDIDRDEKDPTFWYSENGKLIHKPLSAELLDVHGHEDGSVEFEREHKIHKTAAKVQELSLRQFKQVSVNSVILDCLMTLADLIAMPFTYLYHLIVGPGKVQNFASMLTPVKQHDRVGKINHETVLSQIDFVSDLLIKEDPVAHTKGSELINVSPEGTYDQEILVNQHEYPCKVKGAEIEILLPSSERVASSKQGFEKNGRNEVKEWEWKNASHTPSLTFSKNENQEFFESIKSQEVSKAEKVLKTYVREMVLAELYDDAEVKEILGGEDLSPSILDEAKIDRALKTNKGYKALFNKIKSWETEKDAYEAIYELMVSASLKAKALKQKFEKNKEKENSDYQKTLKLINASETYKAQYDKLLEHNSDVDAAYTLFLRMKVESKYKQIIDQIEYEEERGVHALWKFATQPPAKQKSKTISQRLQKWDQFAPLTEIKGTKNNREVLLSNLLRELEASFNDWTEKQYSSWVNDERVVEEKIEIQFNTKSTWKLRLPAEHPALQGYLPSSPVKSVKKEHLPTEEEQNPNWRSASQEAAFIFKNAYIYGKEMQEALRSGSKKRADAIIKKISEQLGMLGAGKEHVMIPLAQGEGRNYLPHYLLFSFTQDDKILLKDICFSTTTQEDKRVQVIKTYDLTKVVSNADSCRAFVRTLFRIQPYQLSRDAEETNLLAPLQRDETLDKVLSYYGHEIAAESCAKKASRDPIKALYTVLKQLDLKENNHLSADHHVFSDLSATKARFFMTYVNHLVRFYEENEGSMLASERIQALKGIQWYVGKVRHYMENELGAELALSITSQLQAFVDEKLIESGEGDAAEHDTLQKLQSRTNLFEATLKTGVDKSLIQKAEEGPQHVLDRSRIGPAEIAWIEQWNEPLSEVEKKDFTFDIQTHSIRLDSVGGESIKGKGEKELSPLELTLKKNLERLGLEINKNESINTETKEYKEFVKKTIARAESEYLKIKKFFIISDLNALAEDLIAQSRDPLSAKTLLLSIIKALPVPNEKEIDDPKSFWNTLKSNEIQDWLKLLGEIGEKMFEANLLSGSIHLKPHEAFEFNVALPLIQRYLFSRLVPMKVKEFEEKNTLNTFYHAQEKISELVKCRDHFKLLRENELKAIVLKELEAKWKAQDAKEKKELDQYNKDRKEYEAAVRKNEAEKQKALRDQNYIPYFVVVPKTPLKPNHPSREDKKKIRQQEFDREVDKAKKRDLFYLQLEAFDFECSKGNFNAALAGEWDNLLCNSDDRTVAVMGHFARIIKLPLELYAFKFRKSAWLGHTFNETHNYHSKCLDHDIWLMQQDTSLLLGSSPELEKRFTDCKEILAYFDHQFKDDSSKNYGNIAGQFSLGYFHSPQSKSDGTQDPNVAHKSIAEGFHNGFFNEGEGYQYLAPEGLNVIRKTDEMRKIMRNPVHHLTRFVDGKFSAAKQGLLGLLDGTRTKEKYSEEFISMKRIHLSAHLSGMQVTGLLNLCEPCFVISTDRKGKGTYCTAGQPETATTAQEREIFLELSRTQAERNVSGDEERNLVDKISNEDQAYRQLSKIEEYQLSSSALCSANRKKRGQLAKEAVVECVEYLTHNLNTLQQAEVRNRIHNLLNQQGLIRDAIRNNPHLFTNEENCLGQQLNLLCKAFQQESILSLDVDVEKSNARVAELDALCEAFIRDFCQTIRKQALDLKDEIGDVAYKIADALPAYDKKKVAISTYDKTTYQKMFAIYSMRYYLNNQEEIFNDVDSCHHLLHAFFLLQQSKSQHGHRGMETELLYKVQRHILPRIHYQLTHTDWDNDQKKEQDLKFREDLFSRLVGVERIKAFAGQKLTYEEDETTPYVFNIKANNETHSVDLRTGEGCYITPLETKHTLLPAIILQDENYKFLFKDLSEVVEKDQTIQGSDIERYLLEKDGRRFEFIWHKKAEDVAKAVQIFQVVENRRFQFQCMKFEKSATDFIVQFLMRTQNKKVESLIAEKGAWIPVDDEGVQDHNKALVAQYGQNIENDPIQLKIRGSKIIEASVGKGKERKWICAGLSSRDAKLFHCMNNRQMILLSSDKMHADEIRIQLDPTKNEQLIFKKKGENWVVDGQGDDSWILQITNTKAYEKRFGPKWREFVLPIKNVTDGSEELWIFPYLAVGAGKRGGDVTYAKSILDFLNMPPSKAKKLLPPGYDLEEIRNTYGSLIGAVESFFGGMDNLTDFMEQGTQMLPQGMEGGALIENGMAVFKEIFSPKAIRYRKQKSGSESSTPAGFFYLSQVAALQGNWASASHYLEQINMPGTISAADAKQFRNIFMMNLIAQPQSALEYAYKAKLFAAAVQLNARMVTQCGESLLDPTIGKMMQGLVGAANQNQNNSAQLASFIGLTYYGQYQQMLPKKRRQLADNGLILDKSVMDILAEGLPEQMKLLVAAGGNMIPMLANGGNFDLGALLGNQPMRDENAVKQEMKPLQFKIPEPADLEELAEVLADYVKPEGVFSIEKMHKKYGSSPKLETLLSNYWDYWEWIYQPGKTEREIEIEDLAFLMQDRGPCPERLTSEEKRKWKAIETARSSLLLLWHYCTDMRCAAHFGKRENYRSLQDTMRRVKLARYQMPDLAGLEEKRLTLEKKAAKEPGFLNLVYAKGYACYTAFREAVASGGFEEHHAGREVKTSVRDELIGAGVNCFKTLLDGTSQFKGYSIQLDKLGKKPLPQRAKVAPKAPIVAPQSVESLATRHSKAIEGPGYEEVKISALKIDGEEVEKPEWEQFFQDAHGHWEERCKENEKYFDIKTDNPRERAKLDKILLGQKEAAADLTERTKPVFDIFKLKEAHGKIIDRFRLLKKQSLKLKSKVLGYTRLYAKELNFTTLFAQRLSSNDDQLIEKILDIYSGPALKDPKLNYKNLLAEEIALTSRVMGRNPFTDDQILQKVFDLYQDGLLGMMDDPEAQKFFASLVTEYLLVTSEMQQHQKALVACQDLADLVRKIETQVSDGSEKNQMMKDKSQSDPDWHLCSTELHAFLTRGSDRLRYADPETGRLKDQKFSRRYLVSDVRNFWISREKAILGLENLLNDMHEVDVNQVVGTLETLMVQIEEKKGDIQAFESYLKQAKESNDYQDLSNEIEKLIHSLEKNESEEFSDLVKDLKELVEALRKEAVRMIIVKMGTGKTDFIFPEAINMLLRHKIRRNGKLEEVSSAIMITSDNLVPQLAAAMGNKAFEFKFNLDFGFDLVYADELNRLDKPARVARLKELKSDENVEVYLTNLIQTLRGLKAQKKAILTSPAQRGYLKNKLVELQDKLQNALNKKDEKKWTSLFNQIELLKQIDSVFSDPKAVILLDEDTNFDISFEYNYAAGASRNIDSYRFEMGEKLMRTAYTENEFWNISHPTLTKTKTSSEVAKFSQILENLISIEQEIGVSKENDQFEKSFAGFRNKSLKSDLISCITDRNSLRSVISEIKKYLNAHKAIESLVSYQLKNHGKSMDSAEKKELTAQLLYAILKCKKDDSSFAEIIKNEKIGAGFDCDAIWKVIETSGKLWQGFVQNNVRTIEKEHLLFLVIRMCQETDFWVEMDWTAEEWNQIDKEELVSYIMDDGTVKKLPKGLPEWEDKNIKNQNVQPKKARIGALKTLMSKTFDSVRGVNPKLGRGIASENGVMAVPYDDGKEKEGVIFGEESECLLHHIFHYMGVSNGFSKKIFLEKFDEYGNYDAPISDGYPETWAAWKTKIGEIKNKEGYRCDYTAFVNSPNLALERLLFLRHLMLVDGQIKFYDNQIKFNSQDLGHGVDIRVGSGTGQPFALNLTDYISFEKTKSADLILGETLLCLNLDEEIQIFDKDQKISAKEAILQAAQEEKCHVVINVDYEISGNDSERLAKEIANQKGHERQVIYRAQEGDSLVKRILSPGAYAYPVPFEPASVDSKKKPFYYFGPSDTRGVNFPGIKRGGGCYAKIFIGTGNQEDQFAQACWRMRHMDMGHSMKMACDLKTAIQIRRVCEEKGMIQQGQPLTMGHAAFYFTHNTLQEEELKNVKATIFKAQKPLKSYLDAEIRKPYNRNDIQNVKLLASLENVTFQTAKSLYMMNNETQWINEYRPSPLMPAMDFVKKLYDDQLKTIQKMRKQFCEAMDQLEGTYRLSNPVKISKIMECFKNIKTIEACSTFQEACCQSFNRPHVSSEAREWGIKYTATLAAFRKAEIELENEISKLQIEKYQEFIEKHLPKEVPGDVDAGSRTEQKTQQKQQQKAQAKQKTENTVLTPNGDNSTTKVVDFEFLTQLVNDTSNARYYLNKTENELISKLANDSYQHNRTYRINQAFEKMGNILSMAALGATCHVSLDREQHEGIYISHRAWQIINKMGRIGIANVELLVIQDKKGNFYTTLITKTEREEKIAKQLKELRNKIADLKVGIYSLSNENFDFMLKDFGSNRPKIKHEVEHDGIKMDETHPEFLRQVVMSKLFLNYSEFTLQEIDYLIKYLNNNKQIRQFYEKMHKNVKVERTEDGIVKKNQDAKILDLFNKILNPDEEASKEWRLQLVKRKLMKNYVHFDNLELMLFKEWFFVKLTQFGRDKFLNKLKEFKITKAVKFIELIKQNGMDDKGKEELTEEEFSSDDSNINFGDAKNTNTDDEYDGYFFDKYNAELEEDSSDGWNDIGAEPNDYAFIADIDD